MEILKEEGSMAVEMEEKESQEVKHVIGGMSDLVIPEEDPILCDSFPERKESKLIEHTNHCRDALCQGCKEMKYHDPLCNETDCQCDLIMAVRKDHRLMIVKFLRDLATHLEKPGVMDNKAKEAWVLRWACDILEAK